ncbi:hypothetical protein H4219_000141 [Mycoemilia scoparia]|uniref:Uncharacterized protein n=1 Tax=Mycoemilia scoparia TaxID=417184 RepID=A0A9W8A4J0_9FUNG|nr:hypothetical protein H4219_000141 [Mycoemilia scoparia]
MDEVLAALRGFAYSTDQNTPFNHEEFSQFEQALAELSQGVVEDESFETFSEQEVWQFLEFLKDITDKRRPIYMRNAAVKQLLITISAYYTRSEHSTQCRLVSWSLEPDIDVQTCIIQTLKDPHSDMISNIRISVSLMESVTEFVNKTVAAFCQDVNKREMLWTNSTEEGETPIAIYLEKILEKSGDILLISKQSKNKDLMREVMKSVAALVTAITLIFTHDQNFQRDFGVKGMVYTKCCKTLDLICQNSSGDLQLTSVSWKSLIKILCNYYTKGSIPKEQSLSHEIINFESLCRKLDQEAMVTRSKRSIPIVKFYLAQLYTIIRDLPSEIKDTGLIEKCIIPSIGLVVKYRNRRMCLQQIPDTLLSQITNSWVKVAQVIIECIVMATPSIFVNYIIFIRDKYLPKHKNAINYNQQPTGFFGGVDQYSEFYMIRILLQRFGSLSKVDQNTIMKDCGSTLLIYLGLLFNKLYSRLITESISDSGCKLSDSDQGHITEYDETVSSLMLLALGLHDHETFVYWEKSTFEAVMAFPGHCPASKIITDSWILLANNFESSVLAGQFEILQTTIELAIGHSAAFWPISLVVLTRRLFEYLPIGLKAKHVDNIISTLSSSDAVSSPAPLFSRIVCLPWETLDDTVITQKTASALIESLIDIILKSNCTTQCTHLSFMVHVLKSRSIRRNVPNQRLEEVIRHIIKEINHDISSALHSRRLYLLHIIISSILPNCQNEALEVLETTANFYHTHKNLCDTNALALIAMISKFAHIEISKLKSKDKVITQLNMLYDLAFNTKSWVVKHQALRSMLEFSTETSDEELIISILPEKMLEQIMAVGSQQPVKLKSQMSLQETITMENETSVTGYKLSRNLGDLTCKKELGNTNSNGIHKYLEYSEELYEYVMRLNNDQPDQDTDAELLSSLNKLCALLKDRFG